MTKRSPTAAALAQPQYRQRVVADKRADQAWPAYNDRRDDWMHTRQADQWMPPARQMEG